MRSLLAAVAFLSLAAVQPLAAAPMQPHSATYDFKLVRASSGSGIAGASGEMTYRMEDACRGWNAEQKATITLIFSQGVGSFDFGWSLESWESKDGQDYRFFLKRLTGGEREEYSGSAKLSDQTAEVSADGGEASEVSLLQGTLFPMAFTEKAIAKAAAGEVLLGAPLYDGGPQDELYEVSMILGKEIPAGEDLPVDALAGLRSWEARAAFFEQGSEQSEPDQEQSFRLYENGVIDHLVLDMGDFAIEGSLSHYEELPGCE
ncbi:MAG: DUF1849 family protein [Limibacillus sp.]